MSFGKTWVFLDIKGFWNCWETDEGNIPVGANLEIKAWKGSAILWKIF